MPNTTQTGVEDKSVAHQNIQEDEKQKSLKAEQKFKEAPIKGFEDLDPDHPMARRAAMMSEISENNEKLDGSREGDAAAAAIIAKADPDSAPGIDAFKEKPAGEKPKTEAARNAEQIAAQTGTDSIVIDAADLAKYQVRTKVDGVEELVPATKVLGQYQKGAAADVRLADATRLQREAKAALDAAQKKSATTTSESTSTQVGTTSDSVAKATAKFKEATEAMFAGEQDRAAELFSEATAALTTSGRAEGTTLNMDDIVSRATAGVKQQLSQQAALDKLFTDYPEIKAKKAFGMITDEYVNAFVSNGDDIAIAITKAGEAVAEEYGFGKFAPQAETKTSGRPANNGSPTTRAEKLSAKEELDQIQSGNVRATETSAAEPSAQQVLAEMASRRPGGAQLNP